MIISAKPVPGNELKVHDAINHLARAGAEVLHQEIAPVHVSGHACAEEIRTLLSLVRPKALMPIHGEYQDDGGARAARAPGRHAGRLDRDGRERLGRGGDAQRRAAWSTASRLGVTFVDGLGVGDVRDVALRDRRHLSEDGVLIIVATLASSNGAESGPPELIARGLAEPGPLLEEMRGEAQRVLAELAATASRRSSCCRSISTTPLGQVIYDRTGRRPMILPVIVEV